MAETSTNSRAEAQAGLDAESTANRTPRVYAEHSADADSPSKPPTDPSTDPSTDANADADADADAERQSQPQPQPRSQADKPAQSQSQSRTQNQRQEKDQRQKQRLVRHTTFITRHRSLSRDDFDARWSTVHAPLVKDWLRRHGVIRYTQYHTHPGTNTDIDTTTLPSLPGSTTRLPYDGQAELLVPSLECLVRAWADPYYAETVAPDEAQIMDLEKCAVSVGWEEVYVAEGRVLLVKEGMINEVVG